MKLNRSITAAALLCASIWTIQAQASPFIFVHSDFVAETVVSTAGNIGGSSNVAGVILGLDGYLYTNGARSGPLAKWDLNNTTTVNGSNIAALVTSASNDGSGGYGITIDTSGEIYSLGSSNLYSVNSTSLASTVVGPAGTFGLAYRNASDTFVSTDGGRIFDTTKAGARTTIASSTVGFIDQVAVDPTGLYIAGAALSAGKVVIWDYSTGIQVALITVGARPDGLAFDQDGNIYTNNTDGTITRLNFAVSGDYTSWIDNTLIASGGFYGDLAAVGHDGAFYVSQYGTGYADGTRNSFASIVKISFIGEGGFVDGGTGGSTDVGGDSIDRISVPLPGTLALFSLGLLGMRLMRKQA